MLPAIMALLTARHKHLGVWPMLVTVLRENPSACELVCNEDMAEHLRVLSHQLPDFCEACLSRETDSQ